MVQEIKSENSKDNILSVDFLEFNDLEKDDILYYIEKYEPYDKSGSYGIQDFSAIFIKSINGCFFNVMGLPLSRLFYYLKQFNLIQF